MLDSTVTRVYACAIQTTIEINNLASVVYPVGRITTKIHRYDCLGNQLEIIVSKGKIHDSKVVINLLQNIDKTKIIS